MDLLLDALLAWLGENADYDVAGVVHPEVVVMSREALTDRYYSGARHLTPEDGVDERLNALYAAGDGPAGTIYILAPALAPEAEAFDDPAQNPVWREYLLHELIHHLQWQTGEVEGWACLREGERAAYLIGGRYLRDTGTPDPLPNRPFWAHFYARC